MPKGSARSKPGEMKGPRTEGRQNKALNANRGRSFSGVFPEKTPKGQEMLWGARSEGTDRIGGGSIRWAELARIEEAERKRTKKFAKRGVPKESKYAEQRRDLKK